MAFEQSCPQGPVKRPLGPPPPPCAPGTAVTTEGVRALLLAADAHAAAAAAQSAGSSGGGGGQLFHLDVSSCRGLERRVRQAATLDMPRLRAALGLG